MIVIVTLKKSCLLGLFIQSLMGKYDLIFMKRAKNLRN